jgi:hypothetical protein
MFYKLPNVFSRIFLEIYKNLQKYFWKLLKHSFIVYYSWHNEDRIVEENIIMIIIYK